MTEAKQSKTIESAALQESVLRAAQKAKVASAALASSTLQQRNRILQYAAEKMADAEKSILEANAGDLSRAQTMLSDGSISQSMVDRLKVDSTKLGAIISGVYQVAEQADPLGNVTLARELDEGLQLFRVSCPIGVIAVIFESRPDALPQIASLSLKSGNAVILKGGSEARLTNAVLFDCFRKGLNRASVNPDCIALFETREAVAALLQAEEYVDLVVPRGSNQLVKSIQQNTRIPVLGHAEGVCHLYVDRSADLTMALSILLDAKTQYPAACNSVETLLLHATIAPQFIIQLGKSLQAGKSKLRLVCDHQVISLLPNNFPLAAQAIGGESEWRTEYSDQTLSVKIVESMSEAISHINKYGSHHTETIITQERETFDQFFAQVNSAGVYWNASTRFADGFRYGFGAEVGISTGKLHPRGPVGLEGLVTYKYKLVGTGHIVADYVGENARVFTHRDLDSESSI